jgi:hypothetical protein
MNNKPKLINPLQFILAGNAIFNCTNLDTQKGYTYKVTKSKNNDYIYFVSIRLDNADTESYTQYEYKYIGLLKLDTNNNNQPQYIYSTKSELSKDSIGIKGFDYIIKHLNNNTLPECFKITHRGKCGRCGRSLTDEKSILLGVGSECLKIMNKEKRKENKIKNEFK